MKKWKNNIKKNSPFKMDEITGAGYICFDCNNNNFFDGEFNIYRYYYKEEDEWIFDFEKLVPMAIKCAKCESKEIIVEYLPGYYFNALKQGDECFNLTLISDNQLIDFEDEEGYSKLFNSLGCTHDLCEIGTKIYNGFKEVDSNVPPFVKNDNSLEHLVLKIVVKNGMKQNYDDLNGIYDDGGTYKEYQVWTPND